MIKLTTKSAEQTAALGEKIGKMLKPGDVLALYGDLGSGKTALTSGVARALNAGSVSSPTFTIVNEYGGTIPLYHFDAYRINSDDWLNCGFDEYLFGDGVCVIEWSENITDILPDGCVKIRISRCLEKGTDVRDFEIEGQPDFEKGLIENEHTGS